MPLPISGNESPECSVREKALAERLVRERGIAQVITQSAGDSNLFQVRLRSTKPLDGPGLKLWVHRRLIAAHAFTRGDPRCNGHEEEEVTDTDEEALDTPVGHQQASSTPGSSWENAIVITDDPTDSDDDMSDTVVVARPPHGRPVFARRDPYTTTQAHQSAANKDDDMSDTIVVARPPGGRPVPAKRGSHPGVVMEDNNDSDDDGEYLPDKGKSHSESTVNDDGDVEMTDNDDVDSTHSEQDQETPPTHRQSTRRRSWQPALLPDGRILDDANEFEMAYIMQEDDWNPGYYLVQWEGTDPTTRQPYEPQSQHWSEIPPVVMQVWNRRRTHTEPAVPDPRLQAHLDAVLEGELEVAETGDDVPVPGDDCIAGLDGEGKSPVPPKERRCSAVATY
ncbi:hypothetical protein H2203_005502 [Taxawa tesnikishii (nom. ined.)]|nr:hypothetical protein H2203_005502 [Dothideales sp. JES 119]